MKKQRRSSSKRRAATPTPMVRTVHDQAHPDYDPGYSEHQCETSGPSVGRSACNDDDPFAADIPVGPFPKPSPLPPWPLLIPVSGKYSTPSRTFFPLPVKRVDDSSALGLAGTRVTARVDVDGYYTQKRISVEISRIFPISRTHLIGEVTSDTRTVTRRTINAKITYRDGSGLFSAATHLTFVAKKACTGWGYGSYELIISDGGHKKCSFHLVFRSKYFDRFNIEVDTVEDAVATSTTYDTGLHPNRPSSLPSETISLATVFQRAGFDVSMSPGSETIPITGAGSNRTWSDSEMHNAMVTYWSKFADRPQWAMWVLYARQHDRGHGLGGVMFDDIGPNHRQGTAVFTDSFIRDVPAGDPDPAAWRERMLFWTAVHEMGHGFNLAHSWQKNYPSYGNSWVPLMNEPEARSFMNYPYNVSGSETAFFSDFRFRFSDDELIFMRHAPRRFVQMGNSDWFVDHGFEKPGNDVPEASATLQIRPNKELNTYRFMEPVNLEFKLTNTSGLPLQVDEDMLEDGHHINVVVKHENGLTKQWRPMKMYLHQEHGGRLSDGSSIYAAHTISATPSGWLMDAPGFYKIQAAIEIGGETVISNVLQLFIAPPANSEEIKLAPDYFTEDIARALVFQGAPDLESAMATLGEVCDRCKDNPASLHAAVALSTPKMRPFKRLDARAGREGLVITQDKMDVANALKVQKAALIASPHQCADSMGHIKYFGALDELATAAAKAGNTTEAKKVLKSSVDLMKKRKVLNTVIKSTERRLAKL